jgi:DNA helicase-2/ATP-dependent DNA helicase PcrA
MNDTITVPAQRSCERNNRAIQDRVGLSSASNFQIDIFNAVDYAMNELLEGRIPNSILVQATAGSGKTSTGVSATRLIPDVFSSIFVAFNKKIADELASRLPPGIPGRTLHSQWFRQWNRHCKAKHGVWPEVNNFKVHDAVNKHFGLDQRKRKPRGESAAQKTDRTRIEDLADNVTFLVKKAKLYGVVPVGYPNGKSIDGMKDTREFWVYLSDFFDQQIEPEELDETIKITRKILWEGLENELVVDYADMLFFPAVKRVKCERFMIVMVDEAQDLNELQHFLLGKMLDPVGFLICIGDRRQSIYQFAGSAANGMDQLKNRFDCVEFPLSISYRCAQRIVDHAHAIYPEIQARPNAPEGSVEYPKSININDFKPGQLIVCRNNAPITKLAHRLVRNRLPAKVIGRDIGKGLTKLVRRLDEDGTIPTLLTNLVSWKVRQDEIAERKGGNVDRVKQQIEDKFECICGLAHDAEITDVAGLIVLIDGLFTAEDETTVISPNRVTLSTIHKIKGAESDTVYVLDPQLINAPWVKTEWQVVQETNLLFVASTRAKTRMVFIRSDMITS